MQYIIQNNDKYLTQEIPTLNQILFVWTKVSSKRDNKEAIIVIAYFIHSCGLEFSIADHPKLYYMCKVMIRMGVEIICSSREMVSGKYLDVRYQVHQEKNQEQLADSGDIFFCFLATAQLLEYCLL